MHFKEAIFATVAVCSYSVTHITGLQIRFDSALAASPSLPVSISYYREQTLNFTAETVSTALLSFASRPIISFVINKVREISF